MKSRLPKVLFASILLLFAFLLAGNSRLSAQIYEPEGLNMPGSWDGWTNPPVNPVLANPAQSAGGLLTKIATGQTRWQTIFSVNASGADLVGGSYDWLFTSGPSSNYYANKWAGVTIVMNTLQTYTKEGATNNNITLVNGKWYTMNWEDLGYVDSRAIFMETSAEPVSISTVSVPANVFENLPVIIQVTASAAPATEEIIYVRYTTDEWATSQALTAAMTGVNGQLSIPGQPSGTTVNYYAFTSTIPSLIADYDLCTIKLNNNGGTNYSFTVGTAPEPEITWANLQWPENGAIETGSEFNVFGQAFIEGITGQTEPAAGLNAWIGYSTTDTEPSTWTNWVAASHNGASGNNDEFIGDIGSAISVAGTYYYATRFQYNDDPFVYGGFNGGFWDGTTNVSGVLTVTDPIPDPDFDWVNLQFPGSATIEPGENLDVFAQAYIEGVTGQASPAPGVSAWIGYSASNTNPASWTNWYPATFNGPDGNNDEYMTNLGQYLTSEGTYYYASRFRLNTGEYYYGGFSTTGGGFWNGTENISGVLTVEGITPDPEIDWANLQFPGSGEITIGGDFDVYAQAFIEGLTGQSTPTPGLEAWIGYSTSNTNPSDWTSWVAAPYNAASGNNDEFMLNLGPEFTATGTYYYASRFRYDGGAYVYGGFSATGGGFWNGTENLSGVLTVTDPIPDPDFDWVNLQFPGSATIEPGENLDVFAQAYIEGVTGQASPAPGVSAWIGYSASNTNPAGWTNWYPATFNGPDGNNDEYLTNLGQYLTSEGTYYYASRFRLNTGEYYYGGFSTTGGGFWNGTENISGVLTVEGITPDPEIDWANLQFPGSGEITIGGDFDVYAQAFIEGLTGQSTATPGLEAWIGYSTSNTNPSDWTSWVAAPYNAASGNNDEFMLNLGPEFTASGTYYYASRFRYDGGAYVYGGFSATGGGFWNGSDNVSGVLTVNEPQQTFPVMFTIIDGTESHDNIKLKGEMTDWNTIAMIPDNHTWTLTLDLLPGTYEWGAIEDDGSENGIWLIEGDNLVVTLSELGEITGTVSYTTMVTYSPALPYGSRLYPNPVKNLLNLEIPGLSAYQLLDLSGRIILDNPAAREIQVIDLSGFKSGIYLLKIRIGERLFVKKVVKE